MDGVIRQGEVASDFGATVYYLRWRVGPHTASFGGFLRKLQSSLQLLGAKTDQFLQVAAVFDQTPFQTLDLYRAPDTRNERIRVNRFADIIRSSGLNRANGLASIVRSRDHHKGDIRKSRRSTRCYKKLNSAGC